jgi:hypothetical protein
VVTPHLLFESVSSISNSAFTNRQSIYSMP